MMSYIPDNATRQRLMRECRSTFPGLSENLVLTVLHENKYDLARAYNTLLRYHTELSKRSSQPNIHQPSTAPVRHQAPHAQPYYPPYNQYPPGQYPLHQLHHSQSDSNIRHQYLPNHNQYPQYAYRTPSSVNYPNYHRPSPPPTPPHANYTNYNHRTPSPQAYPQSRSPRPNTPPNSTAAFSNPLYQSPPAQTQYRQPFSGLSRARLAEAGNELFVDVSGQAGRDYVNIDAALMPASRNSPHSHVSQTPPVGHVPHAPQQCTDPHPASLMGAAVSPIDMKVPQLPFPVIQPALSPHDSPRLADGRRSRTGSQDENAYASALLLQQRARMSKLHKHLLDRKQRLDRLSKEVLEKETRMLSRDNEWVQPEGTAKLTETNRKLQVQIQLIAQEIEHYNAGSAALGVVDPKSQDNFHQSMTELGQAGPMRLPDNTPVHISGASPYDRGREPDEGDPWDCAMCTFRNHPALDRCECCEVPRDTCLP